MEKTFGYSSKARIFSLIFVILTLVCIFTGVTFTYTLPSFFYTFLLILLITFYLLLLYYLLLIWSRKIRFTPTSLISHTLFKKKELALEYIPGYQRLGDGIVMIHQDNPRLRIIIPDNFLAQDKLKQWVTKHFEDLTP